MDFTKNNQYLTNRQGKKNRCEKDDVMFVYPDCMFDKDDINNEH